MTVRPLFCAAVLLMAAPAFAQQPQQPPPPDNPDEPVSYEEQVVVTASKGEQQLVNAPAAVSLVTTETIQNSPAINIGDLLRAVPGLNVTQASARDVNLTSRGASPAGADRSRRERPGPTSRAACRGRGEGHAGANARRERPRGRRTRGRDAARSGDAGEGGGKQRSPRMPSHSGRRKSTGRGY